MKKITAFIFTMILIAFSGVLTAYGSILNYDGQAEVFIRPADKISPYSFPVYVGGKEIELTYWEEKDTFQYTFTYKANGGDIVITPRTGYRITSVVLNEGFVDVWNSDTPATQEQISSQDYKVDTYYDLTNPAIRDIFYDRYPDGTINYNGKFTLGQDFLTKSPYAGWKKGEAMIFAVGKAPGPGGTVTMTVTTEFIPSDGVKVVTVNEPDFTAYNFNRRVYVGHQELEKAINEAINRHSISPGYPVEIGTPYGLIKGAKVYSWPPSPESAHLTVNSQSVSFILLGECQMVLTLVFDGPSKGEIAYSKTLPLNPDVPPEASGEDSELRNEQFFNTFVNSCEVNITPPDTGASPKTFYDYASCNEYLKTIPSNTEVSLTYDFKDDYFIQSASPGTVTNDGKTLNVTLLGPTAIMTEENGVMEPKGEWTGTIIKDENGQPEYVNGIPHYDIDTIGWKQDYTEGETLSVEMNMATPDLQLAIDDFTAADAFGSGNSGHVVTAYISNSLVADNSVLSGSKIKLNGTCEYTNNPNKEKNKVLPEIEYDLGSDISGGTYCGYWFSPANGKEMIYQYTYEINAALIKPDGTEITKTASVNFGGEEIVN